MKYTLLINQLSKPDPVSGLLFLHIHKIKIRY